MSSGDQSGYNCGSETAQSRSAGEEWRLSTSMASARTDERRRPCSRQVGRHLLEQVTFEPQSLCKKMLLFPPPRAARSSRAALLPSNLHRKNLNGRQPLIKALLGPIPTRSLRAALSNPLHRKITISHGHQLRKTTRMQQKTNLTQSIPLIFSIRTLTTTSVLPLL